MGVIGTAFEKVILHTDKAVWVRTLIYVAYAAPLLLTGILLFHEERTDQVIWTATEIVEPFDHYAPDGVPGASETAIWGLNDAYGALYYTEFSKAYFGHESQWKALSEGRPEDVRINVVLKNPAQSKGLLINSIGTVVTREGPDGFDWDRVTVDTDLELALGGANSVRMQQTGIGPALNVSLDLTSDRGLTFTPYTAEIFHFDTKRPGRQSEGRAFSFRRDWALRIEGEDDAFTWATEKDGALTDPVYRRFTDADPAPSKGAMILTCPVPVQDGSGARARPGERCAWHRFPWPDRARIEKMELPCDCQSGLQVEEIRTAARLAQLTDVHRVKAIEARLAYSDLHDERFSKSVTLDLPRAQVVYRRQPFLIKDLLRMESQSANAGSALNRSDVVAAVVPVVKKMAGIDPPKALGVNLIKTDHAIEMKDITDCLPRRSVDEPRVLLNGEGLISMQITLGSPAGGRYHLRVLINGEDRHAMTITVPVPEDTVFDRKDIKRFTGQTAPRAPASCG